MRLTSLLEMEGSGPIISRTSKREALSLANSEGHTLLHLATILGFHRLVDCLVKHDTPLDLKDRNGFTALHFASMYGRVAAARLLLESGAGTFLRNNTGRLAQDIARQRDQADVAALFPSRTHSEATIRPYSRTQSRQSSRSSLFSFFSESRGQEDEAEDFGCSDSDSCSAEYESNTSDIERRFSRNPSTVSLPLEYAVETDDDDYAFAPVPYFDGKLHEKSAAAQKPLEARQSSLFDLATAYSLHIVNSIMPRSAKVQERTDLGFHSLSESAKDANPLSAIGTRNHLVADLRAGRQASVVPARQAAGSEAFTDSHQFPPAPSSGSLARACTQQHRSSRFEERVSLPTFL